MSASSSVFASADLHSVSSTAPIASSVVQAVIGALKSDASGPREDGGGGFRAEETAAPTRIRSMVVTCLFDPADAASVSEASGAFQKLVLQVAEALTAHGTAAEAAHHATSSYSIQLAAACVGDGGDSAAGGALSPTTAVGWPSLDASDAAPTAESQHIINAGSAASTWQSVTVAQDPFLTAGATALLLPKSSTSEATADVMVPRPLLGQLSDFITLHDDDPFLVTEVIVRAVDAFTSKRLAIQRALQQASAAFHNHNNDHDDGDDTRQHRAQTAATVAESVMEPTIAVQLSVARARAYSSAQQQQSPLPAAAVLSHVMVTMLFTSTQSPTGALLQHVAHAQLSAVTAPLSPRSSKRDPAAVPTAPPPPPPLPVARTSVAWFVGLALHEALVARSALFTAASLSDHDTRAHEWLSALHAAIHPPVHGFATRRHRLALRTTLAALSAALAQSFDSTALEAVEHDDSDGDDELGPLDDGSGGSRRRRRRSLAPAPYVELPVGCAAVPSSGPAGVPCVPRSLIQSGDAYFVLALGDVAAVRTVLPLVQRCAWLRRFLKTSMSAVSRRGVPMLTTAQRAQAQDQLRKALVNTGDLLVMVQWIAELAHVTDLDATALPTTSDRRRVEAMLRFARLDGGGGGAASSRYGDNTTTASRRSASSVERAPRLGGSSRGVSMRSAADDDNDDDDDLALVQPRPSLSVPTPVRRNSSRGGDAAGGDDLWLTTPQSPAPLDHGATSQYIAVTPPPHGSSSQVATLRFGRGVSPPLHDAATETIPVGHAAPALRFRRHVDASTDAVAAPRTRDASIGRDHDDADELPAESTAVAVRAPAVPLEATTAFVPVVPPAHAPRQQQQQQSASAAAMSSTGCQTEVTGDVTTAVRGDSLQPPSPVAASQQQHQQRPVAVVTPPPPVAASAECQTEVSGEVLTADEVQRVLDEHEASLRHEIILAQQERNSWASHRPAGGGSAGGGGVGGDGDGASSSSPIDTALTTAASTMRPLPVDGADASVDGEDAIPAPHLVAPAPTAGDRAFRRDDRGAVHHQMRTVSSSSSDNHDHDGDYNAQDHDDDNDDANPTAEEGTNGGGGGGGEVVSPDDIEALLEALRAWKERALEVEAENDQLVARLATAEAAEADARQKLMDSLAATAAAAAAAASRAAAPRSDTATSAASTAKPTEAAAANTNGTAAPRDGEDGASTATAALVASLRAQAEEAQRRHDTAMGDMEALLQRTRDQRDLLQAKFDTVYSERDALTHEVEMWRLAARAAREGKAALEATVAQLQQDVEQLTRDRTQLQHQQQNSGTDTATAGTLQRRNSASAAALNKSSSTSDMRRTASPPPPPPSNAAASSDEYQQPIPIITRTISLLTDPVPAAPAVATASVGCDPVPELNPSRTTAGCDAIPQPVVRVASTQRDAPATTARAASPVASLMAGFVPAHEAAELKKRARAADITLAALQQELEEATKDKANLVASLRAAGSALADAERRADNTGHADRLAHLQQENADLRAWVAALRAEGEKLVAAAQASERDRADLLNVNESLKVLNSMQQQSQQQHNLSSSPRLKDDPSPLLRRPAAVLQGGVSAYHHHPAAPSSPSSSAAAAGATTPRGVPVSHGRAGHHHQSQPQPQPLVVPSFNPTVTGQLSHITPEDQEHFGGFFQSHHNNSTAGAAGRGVTSPRSPSNEPHPQPTQQHRAATPSSRSSLPTSSVTARYGAAPHAARR